MHRKVGMVFFSSAENENGNIMHDKACDDSQVRWAKEGGADSVNGGFTSVAGGFVTWPPLHGPVTELGHALHKTSEWWFSFDMRISCTNKHRWVLEPIYIKSELIYIKSKAINIFLYYRTIALTFSGFLSCVSGALSISYSHHLLPRDSNPPLHCSFSLTNHKHSNYVLFQGIAATPQSMQNSLWNS